MIAVDLLSEIFILIVLGIYLKRNNVIDGHTVDQLTDLIVKIIIPCGIISSFEMKITHKILVTAGMVLIISIGIQVIYFILNSFFIQKTAHFVLSCIYLIDVNVPPLDKVIVCPFNQLLAEAS